MGILSGYKKFKKYLRTADGYQLCSEWTKADSVEMADGSTLQESMDTVVSDVESTQNNITDVHNELKTSLGGMTFGVDAAGRYGYIKAGADTVTPFKNINDEATLSMTFKNDTDGYRTFEPFRFQCPSNTKVLISVNMSCSNASDGNGMSVDLYDSSEGKWININSVNQGGANKTVKYTLDSNDIYRIMCIYSGRGSSNIMDRIIPSIKFIDN